MRFLKYILLFISFSTIAQSAIEAKLQSKIPLTTDLLIEVDNFSNQYLATGNELKRISNTHSINYSNIQLGSISSANAFNPLKINLFYRDFNSVIILDNRLAEITKIDFNTLPEFRLITHVSTGHDNTLWIFNQNTQQLELFDYLNIKTRIKTFPVNETVLDLKSNYNYSWLLTKNHLLVYNYFGSLIKKIPNNGFTNIEEDNQDLFLLKDNTLYFLSEKSTEPSPIKLPELLINQFLVTNESLYIYADEMLHHFQLKKN